MAMPTPRGLVIIVAAAEHAEGKILNREIGRAARRFDPRLERWVVRVIH